MTELAIQQESELLTPLTPPEPLTPSEPPPLHVWTAAIEALNEQLRRNTGCVSSLALRKALEQRGLPEPRALVVQLRYYNFDEPDEALARPSFRWYTHSKSFY